MNEARAGNPDSLYLAGNYRLAALEYEKEYFEANDPLVKLKSRLNRSACHKQMGEFSKAQQDLESLLSQGMSDSLKMKVHSQYALCAYLAGNFQDAEARLLQLSHELQLKILPPELSLINALNYNELTKYPEALAAGIQYLQASPMDSLQRVILLKALQELYGKRSLPIQRDPERSARLSTFLPGAGQVYAGSPGEGIFNFMFHAAALGAGIFGIVNQYYITGYVTGAGVLQKLYFGGIRRSHYLAEKKNYERARKFNDRVHLFLLNCRTENPKN